MSADPSKLAAHQSNPKVRKVMEKLASKFGGAGGPMGGGFPGFPGSFSLCFCIDNLYIHVFLGNMGGGADSSAANDLD